MGEKVQIGNATLYLGDCKEILPTLGPVSAIITDPPYEAEAHTPMRRSRASIEKKQDASLGFDPITEAEREAIARFAAASCSGWVLAFCQAEAVSTWRQALESKGVRYKRAMVWVKPDSSPQFNGQGPAQGYESIVAAWAGEGASRWNGGGRRGVFEHLATHGRFGGHPTEKPMALMHDLVHLFSNAGDVVLDPFMGSGTTGAASIRLGRQFIGIEINRAHFELAIRRLEIAEAQPDMLVEQAMKQESLL